MKRGTVATATVVTLLAVWLGFFVHRAPRFAGGRLGVSLGIAGAVLMAASGLYVLVRRFPNVRKRLARRVSVATLLRLHVAVGIAGALLAIVHTGHRFEHLVGIALTACTLLVVLTGYVGYALLRRIAATRAERTAVRDQLEVRLEREVGTEPTRATRMLASELADLEIGDAATERAKRWLAWWAPAHALLAIVWSGLLAVHVWSAFYFGVRW